MASGHSRRDFHSSHSTAFLLRPEESALVGDIAPLSGAARWAATSPERFAVPEVDFGRRAHFGQPLVF